MKKLFLGALLAVFSLSIYSCRETTEETVIEADLEEAGEEIEAGFEETGEEIEAGFEEAGDEIEVEVEEAGEEIDAEL